MTPFLARLLEISLNGVNIPTDWKRTTVFPIYKGGDQSAVTNYRPIILTCVICKQPEHVIAGYLWQVWDKNDWLCEGQHELRPDTAVKVTSSKYARTERTLWTRGSV